MERFGRRGRPGFRHKRVTVWQLMTVRQMAKVTLGRLVEMRQLATVGARRRGLVRARRL